MRTGIVVKLTEKHIVVLTPDGQFLKLPLDGRNCQIGEEISFAAPRTWSTPAYFRIMSGVAAAAMFCFVAYLSFSGNFAGKPVYNAAVVAYISMDINPSVEIGIDRLERVQEVRGLNPEGEELISRITDFQPGQPLEQFTGLLLVNAEPYLENPTGGEIIIASAQVSPDAEINDVQLAQKVQQTVQRQLLEVVHPVALKSAAFVEMSVTPDSAQTAQAVETDEPAASVQVTGLAVPPELREQAEKEGLLAGKYAIYLAAKSEGLDITVEKLREASVHELAWQDEDLGWLIDSKQVPDKERLKKLLDNENERKLGRGNEKSDADKTTSDKTTAGSPAARRRLAARESKFRQRIRFSGAVPELQSRQHERRSEGQQA